VYLPFPLIYQVGSKHWLDALPHIPQLEKLKILIDFDDSPERIVEQIHPIVTRCPQLRSIVDSDSAVCHLTKIEDGFVRWKVKWHHKGGDV
jgi:hypothetical protein